MAAIRESIKVGADGEVRLTTHVAPGEYEVLVFQKQTAASVPAEAHQLDQWDGDVSPPRGELTFPTLDLSGWPRGSRFSREEIYRDDDE